MASVEHRDCCPGLVGISPAISSLRRALRAFSPSSTAVLITGETGTFKETIAKRLHEMSPQHDHSFVKVRCGSVPGPRLEAGLFGTAKCSGNEVFAGEIAIEADGGTLFFDEIANLPPHTQGKLVDAIRGMWIHESEDTSTHRFGCRLVAATTHDLRGLSENGHFRADLFYQLAIVPLEVPPLRSRGEDIPLLVQGFLDQISSEGGPTDVKVSAKLLSAFSHYHWPGNVRELECIVRRLVTLSRGDTLDFRKLPARIRQPQHPGSGKLQLPPEGANLDDVEKDFILQALERHEGNRTHAAKTLGITRNTLLYRMRKHGLR